MHSSYLPHPVSHLQQRVDMLEKEIKRLQKQVTKTQSLEPSHSDWKEKIEDFLVEQKNRGRTTISILDISHQLSIPIEQVDRIMRELKRKGIKEVE